MMEIAKLKDLVALMKANDLTEVELRGDKESIVIKRGGAPAPVQYAAPAPAPAAPAASAAPPRPPPRPPSLVRPSSRPWSVRSTRPPTPTRPPS